MAEQFPSLTYNSMLTISAHQYQQMIQTVKKKKVQRITMDMAEGGEGVVIDRDSMIRDDKGTGIKEIGIRGDGINREEMLVIREVKNGKGVKVSGVTTKANGVRTGTGIIGIRISGNKTAGDHQATTMEDITIGAQDNGNPQKVAEEGKTVTNGIKIAQDI